MTANLFDQENLNALINLIGNDSFLDFFHQIIGQKLQSLLKTRNPSANNIYDPESFNDKRLFNFLKSIWR